MVKLWLQGRLSQVLGFCLSIVLGYVLLALWWGQLLYAQSQLLQSQSQFQALVATSASLTATAAPAPLTQDPLSPAKQKQLKNLLLHDCGSCHGLTLKGGLGPAIGTRQLAGKPREWVYTTIAEGRPGTPMPPWKNRLSQQEINWLVDALYRGVSNEK